MKKKFKRKYWTNIVVLKDGVSKADIYLRKCDALRFWGWNPPDIKQVEVRELD